MTTTSRSNIPSEMTSKQSQPQLSFPRATFAKLSPHPFLLAHLQQIDDTDASSIRKDESKAKAKSTKTSLGNTCTRANGRTQAQHRVPNINTGSLTHAHGSAVVRLGDTTAVCGVSGEILYARDVPGHRTASTLSVGLSAREAMDLDLLVPNIELATGCSPAFLPGQPPSELAQSLSLRVLALLRASRLVGGEELLIWFRPARQDGESDNDVNMDTDSSEEEQNNGEQEVAQPEIRAYWALYIDILFISLDGNPFDVAWAAVLAALHDVRLPHAYWDLDANMVLCDPDLEKTHALVLRGVPIASTYTVFLAKEQTQTMGYGQKQGEGDSRKRKRYWVLADPDTFEEGLCDEVVTVVVDCSGKTKMLGLEKVGGGVLGKEELGEVVRMAEGRWREWEGVLRFGGEKGFR